MTYARNVGLSASEDRIEKLIAERLQPGADKEQIDAAHLGPVRRAMGGDVHRPRRVFQRRGRPSASSISCRSSTNRSGC